MEIGLFAESARLGDLDETLRYASALGIIRIEFSTGGQCEHPYLDIDRLLADAGVRRGLQHKLDGHGFRLSALNISAFLLHPGSAPPTPS